MRSTAGPTSGYRCFLVIKYVTPTFLLAVFLGTLINPHGGNWTGAFQSLAGGNGWPLDPGSIIGKIFHLGTADTRWFVDGSPTSVFIVDLTRILLMCTFFAIAWSINNVWKRRAQHA